MPTSSQALEDAEAPMPSRLATLEDPGTPDQIVLDQHSSTHFPESALVQSVRRISEDAIHHIENSRNVTQWCHNFRLTTATWETEGLYRLRVSSCEQTPLLDPCFATMVPDSKKIGHALCGRRKQPNGCVTRTRRQRRSASVAAASRHMLRGDHE